MDFDADTSQEGRSILLEYPLPLCHFATSPPCHSNVLGIMIDEISKSEYYSIYRGN